MDGNDTYTVVVHKGVSCPSEKLSEVLAGVKFPSRHHEAHIHREVNENGEPVYVVKYVDTSVPASFKCPVCGGTELVSIVHGDVVCPVKNISVADGDVDYDVSAVDWQKSDVEDLGFECAACHTSFESVEAALAENVKQN